MIYSNGAISPISQNWDGDRGWMQFMIKCPHFEDREEEVYEDLCYITFSSPPEVD